MTEDNRSFKTDDLLATLGTAQAQARVSLDFANTVAIQAHQAAIAVEMGSRIISPGTAHLEFSTASPLVLLQGAFQLQTVIDRMRRYQKDTWLKL